MGDYYLAEKSCSLIIEERLLLEVNEKEVRSHRGENRDTFEIGEDGRPVCMTWDGLSIPYTMIGPLEENRIKDLLSLGDTYWSRKPQRTFSARLNIGGIL